MNMSLSSTKKPICHADDEARRSLPHAVLHELHFFPIHELAFGFVGAALGLAGLFGNVVQFLN